MPDGTRSLSIEQAPFTGAVTSEHRILSRNMRPLAFAMQGPSGHAGTQYKISCSFEAARIDCLVDDPPQYSSSHLSLELVPPYVFAPTPEGFTGDLAWSIQMEVSQAERSVGHVTGLPFISLQDNLRGEDLKLAVIETEQVKYLGQEQVEVLIRKSWLTSSRMSPNIPAIQKNRRCFGCLPQDYYCRSPKRVASQLF